MPHTAYPTMSYHILKRSSHPELAVKFGTPRMHAKSQAFFCNIGPDTGMFLTGMSGNHLGTHFSMWSYSGSLTHCEAEWAFVAFFLISLLFRSRMLKLLRGILNSSATVYLFSPFLMCRMISCLVAHSKVWCRFAIIVLKSTKIRKVKNTAVHAVRNVTLVTGRAAPF